jgi:AraC-like DNA-binding protein
MPTSASRRAPGAVSGGVLGARAGDVALEGGFYDQSHLVNEFRALCGVTPTEFMGRAIAGSSKTAG